MDVVNLRVAMVSSGDGGKGGFYRYIYCRDNKMLLITLNRRVNLTFFVVFLK